MLFDSGINSNSSVPRWRCPLEATRRLNPHARALRLSLFGMETTIEHVRGDTASPWEPAQDIHETLGEFSHVRSIEESSSLVLI